MQLHRLSPEGWTGHRDEIAGSEPKAYRVTMSSPCLRTVDMGTPAAHNDYVRAVHATGVRLVPATRS
jgi:hypothetical protein